MKIQLIAIGKRMPAWVESGFAEYQKRLPADFIQLIEIEAKKRHKGNTKGHGIERLQQQEGEQMLAHIHPSSYVVALAIAGQSWDTPTLAKKIQQWAMRGQTINLLIGGPEGLAPACLARANETWSLSPLTFPHPLVRVIVAEQLYRTWSLLHNHPYHR